MKKNFIIAVLAVFVMMSGGNICKAADVQTDVQHPESEYNSVLPEDVQGPPPPPPEHFAPGHSQNMKKPPHFKGKHPSKKEMEAKKADFEKRLKLTDEQKKQIEENRIHDHEKIKPILDEIRVKKQEFRRIDSDTSLSQEDKEKQKNELRSELKDLKMQADNCRKENMKNFESILTEKQKKEFSKIKEEQRKNMEKRKKEFNKKRGEFKKDRPMGCPLENLERE